MLRGKKEAMAVAYSQITSDQNVNDPGLVIDKSMKNVYLFTEDNALLKKFDFTTRAFKSVLHIPKEHNITERYLFIDNNNRLWIAKADGDMVRINLNDNSITYIDGIWDNVEKQAGKLHAPQLQDKNNNLWLSTPGYGLLKISPRAENFIPMPPGSPHEIKGGRIITSKNNVLLDTSVVNKFFNYVENHNRAKKNLVIANTTYDIAMDAQGFYWGAAYNLTVKENYLIRINPNDCVVEIMENYPFDSTDEVGIPVFPDHHDEIWFSIESSGDTVWLCHFNRVTRGVEKYPFPVKLVKNELHFIGDWYVDENNRFWLGTKQGLFLFNPESKLWKHYFFNKDEPQSISNNYILTVCPDPVEPARYLWIGTDGGGMNKLEIASGKFTHFKTENGLPNDVINAIQYDNHNNLWLSTNNGLCLFNTKTFETRIFTSEDGLPGNEFNRTNYSKTKEGHLYFGGPSGAVLFNPEDFYKVGNPSTVIINQLKLLNKPVTFSAKNVENNYVDYFLPAPIEHCKKLEFTYNQSMITLGFALLDLTTPSKNRFKYRLEGFNDDWIDAGELHEATFTNLNPGSYTFKVLGRNSSNVWSTEPATLKLTILPPWWGTWWFRILVLVVIASGIYSFYRYRLAQQTRLLTIRNRIASDLHDEIGSTLSSISLSSTIIQKKMNGDSKEVSTLLNQISTNTDNMMEAISDIVWSINTKNDRFDNVINRMRAFVIEILEPKGCLIHFNTTEKLNALTLDMAQRKNIYLLFKEAINNAAKYAECKNVWVDISLNGSKKLVMKIKDDGIGFNASPQPSPKEREMGGNGLSNMHKRAHELYGEVKINSEVGKGTEVVLEFMI